MTDYEIAIIDSPLGMIEIVGDEKGITAVSIRDQKMEPSPYIPESLEDCVCQLKEYFIGQRKIFSLKLNPEGTIFQKKVWQELLEIPFGSTSTYKRQSMSLGNIKAIRAVASANGKNPVAIIIPCHRVIGSDGSLTGYASGLWRKKWLLDHESPFKQTSLF